jgi:hypothetical protein
MSFDDTDRLYSDNEDQTRKGVLRGLARILADSIIRKDQTVSLATDQKPFHQDNLDQSNELGKSNENVP